MIAEAGLAALWFAALLAAFQLALALGIAGEEGRQLRAVRAVAVGQAALTIAAFALLIVLFLQSDMSVRLVAENSHSQKPLLYKFAGTWGNHEGSMLLWVSVLAVIPSATARMAMPANKTKRKAAS